MKISKIAPLCLCALSMAFLTSACGIFESDEDENDPFLDKSSSASLDGKNGRNSGEAELNGMNGENNGPTKFGDDLTRLGVADEFGEPIPGVHLEIVYFGFDQSSISLAEQAKLAAAVDFLSKNGDAGIVIEGHCDDRGSEEYNRALGEKRALSAKEYMLNHGITENRLKVISYGEERPAVVGENESAWSKNRRAELKAVKLRMK